MHILLIHQAYTALDEAGGTRHAEMAAHLVRRGHQVTVISSAVSYLSGTARAPSVKSRSVGRQKWISRETAGPSVTVLRTYTFPALHRSFFHRLISFMSFMLSSFTAGLGVRNVDVVWGTSPPIFQGITAWLLSRLKRAPLLFEVRDLWPDFAVELGILRSPLLIRASKALEKFLYRQASRVVVNSPGFIDHVLAHGARLVELIPNGADPDMFDPREDGTNFRRQHNLTEPFLVLYAGAHGMANDLQVVLEAARCLIERKDIRFVMLGDGKEKAALQDEAHRLNLTNVTFLPPVAKNEMKMAAAASNACLAILKPVPLFKTTYPNKVFDYMAAGRPVILAIDGVIRRVIEETGAGIALAPGDPAALAEAVIQLAENPDKCREMGAAGRKAVEQQYSRRAMADKLALLVEEMRWTHG